LLLPAIFSKDLDSPLGNVLKAVFLANNYPQGPEQLSSHLSSLVLFSALKETFLFIEDQGGVE
jgi:hypothetical protein